MSRQCILRSCLSPFPLYCRQHRFLLSTYCYAYFGIFSFLSFFVYKKYIICTRMKHDRKERSDVKVEHMKAFFIKLLFVSVLVFSVYGIFNDTSLFYLIVMALFASVVTYAGDVYFLPKVHPVVAGVVDFVLYFLLFAFFGSFVAVGFMAVFIPAFIASYFGTFSEAFFHIYVMDRIHDVPRGQPLPTRFQTEFSEELNKEVLLKRDEKKEE